MIDYRCDKIARALARCTFLPGSWDKRFARDMSAIASGANTFTEQQRVHLLRLAHKYRRQLTAEITCLALDEAEAAADRRRSAGIGALAVFTKTVKTPKVKPVKIVEPLPLFAEEPR